MSHSNERKKGIKLFGEKALTAIEDEYKQMDDLNVFQPIQLKDLPTALKPNINNAIDLSKEK